MTPAQTPDNPQHTVTAVLVVHDGERWLPRSLAGLAAQTVPPDRVVAVDTGSEDGSVPALEAAVGAEHVLRAPRDTGFGEAVGRGLALLDDVAAADAERPDGAVEWVWLLHDDVEADPHALEHLLAFVASAPSVAVAGPKITGWNDRRLLLEVGLTIARSGRRETGLERREHDQGQHDGIHDVLAVTTAGMLVRRDVWDALGGLDPSLALFRDDIDFGWRANLAGHRVVCVTDAVVHHAEAAAHGRRQLAATVDRHHRVDRRNALFVLLANLPLLGLPWAGVRLGVGCLVRSVGYLAGKLPRHALDELVALVSVLGRPDRVARARLARRRTRVLPARSTRHLLASPAAGARHAMESLAALLGPGLGPSPMAGRHRAVESGPASDDVEDLPSWGTGLLRRTVRRPGVLLGLALSAVTLLAVRSLFGEGRLMGGALLPAPGSAGDLWHAYTTAWHPVGVGSDTPAPPYLAVVAGLGTLLLGHASLAVDLLLLVAVPLSGLTAYLAVRSVVRSTPVRLWAAGTYAVLPALTGSVATGRLGTAVVCVLLPLAALALLRAVGGRDRPGTLRAAWGAGLLLAVMSAFAPMTYLLAVGLAVVAAAATVRSRAGALRLLVPLAVPPVLLLPWLPALVADPQLLLLEAGFPGPGLSDPALSPFAVLLAHPGGPGMYPLVFSAGLLLAGLAALLRADRRRLIVAGWVAVLVGVAVGVVASRTRVTAPTLDTAVPAWPGPATVLVAAGLLLAAAVGVEGARERIARSSFGWRQPAAVVVLAAAVAGPVLAAGWWAVRGADDPVERRDPVLLPAFVAAEGQQPDRPRTLVLRARGADALTYALLGADGPRLGDAETAPPRGEQAALDGVVADLASGRGGDAAARLLPYGVRFVLVRQPVGAGLESALDAVPGLVRLSDSAGATLWRVGYASGRVRLVEEATRASSPDALTHATVLPAGRVDVTADVPLGGAHRLVTLADRRDGGWRATLDGRPLTARTYDGWAQAFALPHAGGRLVVHHDDGHRGLLLWVQGIALVVVFLLALPGAKAEDDADEAAPAGRRAKASVEPVPAERDVPELQGSER